VLLLVFTVIGVSAGLVGFAFGLGGAVSSVIFLAILFTGVMVRWSEPLRAGLRR
jgi:hypothetical protein